MGAWPKWSNGKYATHWWGIMQAEFILDKLQLLQQELNYRYSAIILFVIDILKTRLKTLYTTAICTDISSYLVSGSVLNNLMCAIRLTSCDILQTSPSTRSLNWHPETTIINYSHKEEAICHRNAELLSLEWNVVGYSNLNYQQIRLLKNDSETIWYGFSLQLSARLLRSTLHIKSSSINVSASCSNCFTSRSW